MENHSLLLNASIFLTAAVVSVPLAKKLGLGSVLGYLLAGIIIGPWGLKIINDAEDIMHFAEFGVVLLLFLIGLELNPSRLWSMRKPIIGTGGMQVVVTTFILFLIAILFGINWIQALVAAMGLALSSTAIALQILTEKNLLSTPAGRSGFSVLLFQDIAVIPMLAIIPLLATSTSVAQDSNTMLTAVKIVGVIAFIIIGGRYLVLPIFRFIASSRLREIFTAFSLLMVIGIALLMQMVELSMALGTFLEGVLLAESEYRHQIESDLEPFKGLLLGLFFISVGISIDFGLLFQKPGLILALVLGLVFIKTIVLFVLGKLAQIPLSQNFFFAFLLSQGGEFAFVLFGFASSVQVLPPEISSILIVSVAFSMMTTPFLLIINEKIIEPRFNLKIQKPNQDTIDQRCDVIIAGFGRFGQIVARLLHACKMQATVIDHNPEHIERVKRFGFKIFYGDVAQIDLLRAAGIEKAKLLILAIDDWESMIQTASIVKKQFPHVTVIARAWDMVHAYQLMDVGVTLIERDTFESALNMGEVALQALGYNSFRAKQSAHLFKKHDIEAMYEIYKVHKDEEQVFSRAQEAREDLEKLFETDEKEIAKDQESGWG